MRAIRTKRAHGNFYFRMKNAYAPLQGERPNVGSKADGRRENGGCKMAKRAKQASKGKTKLAAKTKAKTKTKTKTKPTSKPKSKPTAKPALAAKPAPQAKRPAMLSQTAALTLPPPVKQLQSGAGVPVQTTAAVFAALNAVASAHNVDPAAIAGIINTESAWKTDADNGTYVGLTQVGPDFLQHVNKTKAEFKALSAAQQINYYGQWLDYSQFGPHMATYKFVLSAMSLAKQAAVLQGVQFAPYGTWMAAMAGGDTSSPTTTSKQAAVLGNTSIDDMTSYYAGFFKKRPPVYA
jgi:hypothetical protein